MDELSAVLVTTPNWTHKEIVIKAFEAGNNVFCEKPLATTLKDCDEMIAAGEKAGKLLQVGLVYRYSNFFRKMKEIIARGDIGDLQMMWCKEFRVPFSAPWKFKQTPSGGAIVEKNCHHFDIFNWMIEAKAVRVSAFGGQNVIKKGKEFESLVISGERMVIEDSEIVDNAWIIAEYENGARVSLGLCFFSPYGNDLEIGAIGNHGKLESLVNARKVTVWGYDKPDRIDYEVAEERGFGHYGGFRQHVEFLECVKTGKPTFADGSVGKESIVIALAAEKAIKEKRMVSVDELE